MTSRPTFTHQLELPLAFAEVREPTSRTGLFGDPPATTAAGKALYLGVIGLLALAAIGTAPLLIALLAHAEHVCWPPRLPRSGRHAIRVLCSLLTIVLFAIMIHHQLGTNPDWGTPIGLELPG